jgi:hypothetical protein
VPKPRKAKKKKVAQDVEDQPDAEEGAFLKDDAKDVNYDLENANLGEEVKIEIPRDLTITTAQMEARKVMDSRRWHCLARPQYPKSCGISSLTSCWNYLFSTLGRGTHRPISTEEALEVVGIKPPYHDKEFGAFTGNDTLIRWFGFLNRYFKVKGEARIVYKLHGKTITHDVSSNDALQNLKAGLRSESRAYIYHCYNHYMCPIGFEETPSKPYQAYAAKEEICETDDWIIIGEISKMYPCFHVRRWADIHLDISQAFPNFYNIRKPEAGVQEKTGKIF